MRMLIALVIPVMIGLANVLPLRRERPGQHSNDLESAPAARRLKRRVSQRRPRDQRSAARMLRRIVRAAKIMSSGNCICREPLFRPRHSHCRGVWWPVATTEPIVLGRLGLKSSGAHVLTTSTMMFSESLIPIKEVDVGLAGQFGVAAHARNPHQYLRRSKVETKSRDRLVPFLLTHKTRLANVSRSPAAAHDRISGRRVQRGVLDRPGRAAAFCNRETNVLSVRIRREQGLKER